MFRKLSESDNGGRREDAHVRVWMQVLRTSHRCVSQYDCQASRKMPGMRRTNKETVWRRGRNNLQRFRLLWDRLQTKVRTEEWQGRHSRNKAFKVRKWKRFQVETHGQGKHRLRISLPKKSLGPLYLESYADRSRDEVLLWRSRDICCSKTHDYFNIVFLFAQIIWREKRS